jgi:hypothetical protein
MVHDLITPAQRALMRAYGARSATGEALDPRPVVKLFTPAARAAWLLTELDPDDPDIAFGLCDLGLGFPELGSVRLSEIASLSGRLRAERDLFFEPDKTLLAYAEEASACGFIRA